MARHRVRARDAKVADRVLYTYEGEDHWSAPIESIERLDGGEVRFHLTNFDLTMRYRSRQRITVLRGRP